MGIEGFENALRGELENAGIAGAAWSITDRRSLLSASGFGLASTERPGDPVLPETLFRIASNTKITVTLTAFQLREKGLITLDEPVEHFFPGMNLSDRAAAGKITLRRLLSHTAGFPAEYTPDGVRDEDRSEEVLLRELDGLRLLSDPDEGRYLYSNLGIRLAAAALCRVGGKPFSELCREYVLEPLGMDRSFFDLSRICTYPLALPHNAGPKVQHYVPINAARYAAGGLFSNVEDMAKLARLFLNRGAPLVSGSDWDEITAPAADMGLPEKSDYCLTLMRRHFGDVVLTGHTGSAPPYRSCIWVLPEKGLGVSFASNTEGGERFTNDLVPRIFIGEFT